MCLFPPLAADSLGRRRSLLWTALAQAAVLFYIGLYLRIRPPVSGEPLPVAGYVALACIYIFAVIFQFGWGPVPWIYVAEIPTMRLRSLNIATAACTQWLFNFVIARTTPNMLATLGSDGYGTFFLFGSFSILMFVFAWVFVPETKGMFLEDMDDLFGILELAQRMLDEAQLENDVPSRPESWAGSQRPSFMRQRSSKGHSLDKIQLSPAGWGWWQR